MVEGVVDDQVTVSGHALDQLRIGKRPPASHAKCGWNAKVSKRVEDVLGVPAIGASVEGERDDAGRTVDTRRDWRWRCDGNGRRLWLRLLACRRGARI